MQQEMINRRNRQLIGKIIICCSFVFSSTLVIIEFMTARTYGHLAVAILLYPLPVYFAFKAFPRKKWSYSKKPATAIQPQVKLEEKAETAKRENMNIADIDKRSFLKMIGAAGLSLLLFSIFNKRIDGLFSKNLPGSGRVFVEDTAGNKNEYAQPQPTDGYRISEIDDSIISYYGFIKTGGDWFIMREDTDKGSFRYTRGSSDFSGNWTNRENLKYDYFDNVF